ncbi:hypothetical protein Tco_0574510, partial [Tanacetum coccineum]
QQPPPRGSGQQPQPEGSTIETESDDEESVDV